MFNLQALNGIKAFKYDWGFAKLQSAKLYKYIDIHLCPIIDFSNEARLQSFNKDISQLAKNSKVAFCRILPSFVYQRRDQNGKVLLTNEGCTTSLKSLNFKHLGYNPPNPPFPQMLFIKNLDGIYSKEELLKTFSGNARTMINKAEKSFLTIRKAEYKDIKSFKLIVDSSAIKHGFIQRPLEYFQNMSKSFGDKLEIMIVSIDLRNTKNHLQMSINEQLELAKLNALNPKKQGFIKEISNQIDGLKNRISAIDDLLLKYPSSGAIDICAYLFIDYLDELICVFGGTNTDFEIFSASYLMQAMMMQKALELKKKYYNFYGISGKFDGSDGVLKFKQNFGGEIIELPGYFERKENIFGYLVYKLISRIRG